ncbi:unnamed protein product [Spirodela intermedia]|uniref:Uncharacterized protein n=1 Tax=Spirodela intermedia TaxID=51605 RepID=A0A7I8LLL0_SPIIN|nr:unnamed protein product [Spirodela intermedia]
MMDSPVVAAGADAGFEAVESVGVSEDNGPAGDGGDELDGAVAVAADAQVLEHPQRLRRRGAADQPEGDGNLLAVLKQVLLLELVRHVVEGGAQVGNVPHSPDLRSELPELRVDLTGAAVAGVAGVELVDAAGDLDPAEPRFLPQPPLLHPAPYLRHRAPPPRGGVDVGEQHVGGGICRLRLQDLHRRFFSQLEVSVDLAGPEQSSPNQGAGLHRHLADEDDSSLQEP